MNATNEDNKMRILAIAALATAFIVTIVITVNSGILSGNNGAAGGGGAEPEVTPAAVEGAAEGEQAQEEAPDVEPQPPADGEEEAPITLETETYVVEGGDSFFSIATKFDTTIDELLRLNPSVNPQNLMPGTELAVPRSGTAEE